VVELIEIILVLAAAVLGCFAYYCGTRFGVNYLDLARESRKKRWIVLALCLASILSSVMSCVLFSLGINILKTSGFALEFVLAASVSIAAAQLCLFKKWGERLGREAGKAEERVRRERAKEEIEQLREEADFLRSELRKKSRELKAVKANSDAQESIKKLESRTQDIEPLVAQEKMALGTQLPIPPRIDVEEKEREKQISPEELLKLKADGWKFCKIEVKGREYVKVRKSIKGKRVEKSLGRLDGKMKKALKAADISLK
jgi:hypothetical protein